MKVVMRVAFILCLWAVGAVGQEKDLSPIMTAELAEDSVAVGQPLVLRVTVLVPTWMPKPPVFPSFDAPNMILRLPERASTPISKRINGDTWAGISRSYRLYPMIPGVFNLSPNALEITYADPETLKPIEASLPLPAISFTATVPSGAEDLDPLIVAEDVTLTQTFEGPDKVLSEGEAVVRRVTAQIAGSSPLFLPDMIGVFEADAVQVYVDDPAMTETENRGVLSGTRTETATYVARYGGEVDLPEISVRWFNTASGQVETATLDGQQYSVDAPERPREPLLSRRQMLLLGFGVLLLGGVLWAARRWALPPLRAALEDRKNRHLASEAYAAKLVDRAIAAKDLKAVASARALWDQRLPPAHTAEDAAFDTSLLAIGGARYGSGGAADWSAVQHTFDKACQTRRALAKQQVSVSALPPLNPF